jgi:cupin 2 domain-containing protein
LLDGAAAPAVGEVTHLLGAGHGFTVEQILSGRLDVPSDFDQPHDEWVVLLEGSAVLEVVGERRVLGRGDWLLLRAHVPHRVVSTAAGTSWLAVRGVDGDGTGRAP